MKHIQQDYPDLILNLDAEKTREKVSSLLNEMDERSSRYGEPDVELELVRSRLSVSLAAVYISAVIGPLVLLAASLFYLSLPSPSVYATTQEGKLIQLRQVQK